MMLSRILQKTVKEKWKIKLNILVIRVKDFNLGLGCWLIEKQDNRIEFINQ